jgi:hypothetical protein
VWLNEEESGNQQLLDKLAAVEGIKRTPAKRNDR